MINYIKMMKDMDIKINWGTIYLGWVGLGSFTRLLSFEDIFNYGSDKLDSMNNKELQTTTELLSLYGDARAKDTELVKNYLLQLINITGYDEKLEIKKWTLVLLKNLMLTFNDSSCVEILTELTGFWANFDYPEYSPHIVQGRKNSIGPQEYYTDEFCNMVLSKHQEWIADQLVSIQKYD